MLSEESRNQNFGNLEIRLTLPPSIPQDKDSKVRILQQSAPLFPEEIEVFVRSVPIDAEGRFKTGRLPVGDYMVCTYQAGQLFHQHIPVEVVADQNQVVHAEVRPNCPTEIRFVDEQGNPRTGYHARPVMADTYSIPLGMRGQLPNETHFGFSTSKGPSVQVMPMIPYHAEHSFHIRSNKTNTLLFTRQWSEQERRAGPVTVVMPDDAP